MRLRLKNAKGIKAGPSLMWDGRDEIEIDFAGRAGLIALAGENGSGKSSVLENLSHYPQLVSRGGALWSHFVGRDAEKEFECDFMGNHYRSLIKMDAEQEKQEGFLWINGKPVCNGKISAYKEKVNEIFGQPFTYFRSQFCPQKSKTTQGMQIENMTAGVFRELLQQFLNLQRYATWEDTSKQVGNVLTGKAAALDTRIDALATIIMGRERLEEEYFSWGEKAEGLRDNKTILQHALEEKKALIPDIQAKINANAVNIQRRADLAKQIEALIVQETAAKAEAEKEIAELQAKYREIKGRITAIETTLKEREAIEQAAGEVKRLEEQATEIQGKIDEINENMPGYQAKVHEIETQIAQLRQQAKDLDPMIDPENTRLGKLVDQAERTVKEKEREITTLDFDAPFLNLDERVRTLEQYAKVGDGIDATCQSVTCAAIRSVNESRAALPAAREALETRKKEMKVILDGLLSAIEEIKMKTAAVLREKALRLENIAALRATVNGQINTADHDLRSAQQLSLAYGQFLTTYRKDLAAARAEIAKQKALADRLPEIQAAELRKGDLDKQLAETTAQGKARAETWETKRKGFEGHRAELKQSQEAIVIDEQAERCLQSIQAEIREIETVKIAVIDKERQGIMEKITTLKADLEKIKKAGQDIEDARSEKADLLTRIGRWKYLQLGCGKPGLQNLRIDGAAPRIIYNANRLLSQAYGARYAVKLETQKADTGKEDLQIKIIMENGKEIYLDDISGGQRAWNVQALWLAMSLLNQEKSGRKFDYFCSDESDGALDVENAEKYTALYRPFMAEGKLDRLIYVSHKPSCRAMADHVLMFEHGKNPEWG